MAAIYTPTRQPFGILDESKLRSLQSVKNRQNALVPTSTPSLKRRAPSPELSDSENIDPNVSDGHSKRKRASIEDDVPMAKKLCLSAYTASTNIQINTHRSSYARTTIQTPRLDTVSRQASNVTPASAPAVVTFAAGRSPTRLSTRIERPLSQPRRRFVPPSFHQTSPSVSIISALKGTLTHKRSATRQPRRQSRLLDEPQPRSWHFEIYEESEETQDYRMSEWTMTQSSAALDISDDESKSKSGFGQSDKEKENIDPNEALTVSVPVTRAAAAAAAAKQAEDNGKESMDAEQPRTPLGDLKTADYYGEGLDATSVVLVHDEDPVTGQGQEESPLSNQTVESGPSSTETSFTFTNPTSLEESSTEQLVAEDVPVWAQRTASSIDTSVEVTHDDIDSLMPVHEPGSEPAVIDIWESESAKDENENAQEDVYSNVITVWEGESVSASAFCLQEL